MLRTLVIAIVLLLATWALLVVAAKRLPPGLLKDLAGFLPACLTTVRRLRNDPRVPGRAKLAILLAGLWLLSPIDLLPEFLPIIGPLDDVLVVALALRYAGRSVPRQVLLDAWPADPRLLERLLGPPATPTRAVHERSKAAMHQEEQQLGVDPAALRLGAVCVILGGIAVFGFRLAHGDLPAARPEAALRFITNHPAYAGVHLGAIGGVLVWGGGLVTLSGTLRHRFARVLGRLGAASVLVGAAMFIVDFSIDGVAGQALAKAWAAARPLGRADLVRAADTAFTMLRGTSLTSVAILWGLPLVLFGRAVLFEGYPSWLGWTGLAVGAATIVGATTLALQPDLFPGVLLYGLLVSVVQLWSLTLGTLMWRRAGAASGSMALPRNGT